MKALNVIALVLVVVGALNWGLVGLAGFDLVAAIFGEMSILSRLVYVVVGLAGLYCLLLLAPVAKIPSQRIWHPTAHA